MYVFKYLDKDTPIEVLLFSLINEVKEFKSGTDRCIIYCQTRRQSSVLYTMFELFLGRDFYHGEYKPQNRYLEMYHAGTPTAVTDAILRSMSEHNNYLRIVIVTVPFGMGVNCKEI